MDSNFVLYMIIGFSAIAVLLIIFTIYLAAALGSSSKKISELSRKLDESRRDIEESRRDTYECKTAVSENYMQMETRMEAMRNTIDTKLSEFRNENKEQLDKMRFTVDEKLQETLDSRLSRSFEIVRKSLDEVYKGLGEMQGLAEGVGDLKKVLTNVKSRGIVGEIQLGAILEQILSKEQYLENTPVVPGASQRVEYAVKMPGDGESSVLLPIDAKFPGDAYSHLMEAYEAADPAQISECRKILSAAIKKAAKDIHDKYICPPFTTDFAVMFLPFEGLYAEVVNMGLIEDLQADFRVMIAGPSTTAALLNSLQMGFKTLAIQQNAGRVWQVLGSVKGEFDKFQETLESAQKRIDQANKELDKLIGTRTRMILRTLKDVQSLGGGLSENYLPEE